MDGGALSPAPAEMHRFPAAGYSFRYGVDLIYSSTGPTIVTRLVGATRHARLGAGAMTVVFNRVT